MGLISFVFRKAYLFFLLFWVLDFLNSLEIAIFAKYTEYSGEYQIEFILIYVICLNLGELLSGFLVLYTKLKMNYLKGIETRKDSKKKIKLIYNDLSLKKNKYILIILVSILDFLGRGYTLIFLIFFDILILEPRHIRWIISVDIFARIFFGRIMLNIKLYKHHIISMCICSIGFFIMTIFALQSILFGENGKFNETSCWIYIIFTILQKICFSFGDTISKILLTDKFILPHYLMFYKSLACFIIFLILTPILFLTGKISFANYQSLFYIGDYRVHILLKIFIIIFSFFGCFSIFKIIDIFTPIHVGFLNVVSSLFQVIQFTIRNETEHLLFLIFYIICLILIAFGTLIFTEILIINAWGLNEHTKTGFLIKEKLDQLPPEGTVLIFDNEENNDINETKNNDEEINKARKVNKTVEYKNRE